VVIAKQNLNDVANFGFQTGGVNKIILSRKSAVRFDAKSIEFDILYTIIEAASCAPSNNNEQPWRFFLAGCGTKEFDYLVSAMSPQNQDWACTAGALILACCKTTFERNGLPNRSAFFDLGAAMAFLSLQAESSGLSVHQIGGFDAEFAGKILKKQEEDVVPVVIAAVGFPATEDQLSAADLAKARRNRQRRNLDDLIIF
jgi:nitroreductase